MRRVLVVALWPIAIFATFTPAVRAQPPRPSTTSAPSVAASVSASASATESRAEDCATSAERAQLLKLKGRLREARDEALRCAQESCPNVVLRDCTELFAAVDKALPTLIFVVHDKRGADIAGATVSVEGSPTVFRVDGKAVSLDPGSYVFRASAAGHRARASTVVLVENEKARRVEIVLDADADVTVSPTHRSPIGPIVLASTGALALGSFAAFGIASWNRYGELRDRCAHACSPGDVDDLRRRALAADISLGVGVAALTTAALWWWWPSARSEGVSAAIVPTSTGVSSSLSFRF